MLLRQLAAGLAGATLLTGVSALVIPATANAAPQTGHGYPVPAQKYLNNPDPNDWMGSYLVAGKQVWCVNFALKAPEPNEPYQPGQTLQTKWNTALDPTIAAEISFLLLRFGNTSSDDEAAALAHLLHTWTAAPQTPDQLNIGNDFAHIAYDTNLHLSELRPSTLPVLQAMQAQASADHGPWTASIAKPTGAQLIGTADHWTITVLGANNKGVPSVPVSITATDATLPDGKTTDQITTPSDGSPLTVAVTPTGPNPALSFSLASPAATPTAQTSTNANVQKVVMSGGETQLTGQTTTTAKTPPGTVQLTKTDANTKAPIVGASFELTGSDKASPAIKQDGAKLTGQDGKPLVFQTTINGTITVADLQAPQDICLIEIAAPPGFEQFFPKTPPSVCGRVDSGQTLSLQLTNVPNKIPVAIPAGGAPANISTAGVVLSRPIPAVLVALGGLLLVGGSVAGAIVARRARRR